MSLAFELEYAGDVYRFGPDERHGKAAGITFDTSAGGGYGRGSVVIPKPEWKNEDGLLFSPGRFYDGGANTRYEGRVADVSQEGDDNIRLDLEGWAASLDDNHFFRAIYTDRDLSRWQPMNDLYKAVLIGLAATSPGDGQVSPSPTDGVPTILLSWTGNASAVSWKVGLEYRSLGIPLEQIYYEYARGANTTASFVVDIRSDDEETLASSVLVASLAGLASNSARVTVKSASVPSPTIIMVALSLASDGGTEGVTHDTTFKRVAVFGQTGLTVRGTAPDEGFYPGDIIAHAVDQGAPMLNIGEVESGPPVVAQAAYLEPTTVRSVIEEVGAYGTPSAEVPEWGVYDNREFFWRTPGAGGRRWRVRRDQLATPVDDGPSSANRYAEAVVKYTTGGGDTFYVGPPGSGADDTDARLQVSPLRDNPASNVPGRRMVVDAGVTFLEGAILLGQAELADVNSNTRRGSATVGGHATDAAGVTEPASAVRAGDTLLVEDEEGVEPTEQYVNSTAYTDDNATVVAQLGTEPLKLERFVLARLRNAAGF